MGVDIAEAALAAGHAVVATGRNTKAVADAVGEADDVLVVKLDEPRLSRGRRSGHGRPLRPDRRAR
jgi:phosphosulfolactate phosphohydrolase-like enzyme